MINVVITGATQGIGKGLAREFAARGCNVAICGRSEESLAAALEEMSALEGRVVGRSCDVSQFEQLQALWDLAAEEFGGVDIWIALEPTHICFQF